MPDRPSTVICNTSPLQYLHQARCLDLLPRLYQKIAVPRAVADEIENGRWLGHDLPELTDQHWIHIEPSPTLAILRAVTDLGPGEREALALAVEKPGALVILDDALARRHADLLGVRKTGTLGILVKGKRAGLIPVIGPIVDLLEQLRFRVDPETRSHVLGMVGE